jgi:hypothetical protein
MKTLTAGREVKRGGSRSSAPYCLEFLAAAREPTHRQWRLRTVQLFRNLLQHCMQFQKASQHCYGLVLGLFL